MLHHDPQVFAAAAEIPGRPAVSVITPMHNGAAHVLSCIRSVQAQEFQDYEHIIVDNNSTDGSADIVTQEAALDPRIRLMHNRERKGPGPTRNMGIEAARGRYIAFLDCDDTWLPSKLERQLSDMQARGLALSWTSYDVCKNGAHVRIQRAMAEPSRRDFLTKRAVIGCLTAIYDADLVGKAYMNDLGLRQDFCLWLDIITRAEAEGLRYGGLDEVLATYFVHDEGISADKKKAALVQWRVYREHAGLSRLGAASCMLSYTLNGILDRVVRPDGRRR